MVTFAKAYKIKIDPPEWVAIKNGKLKKLPNPKVAAKATNTKVTGDRQRISSIAKNHLPYLNTWAYNHRYE